ncbi:hypothetical protein [Draconibacterium sp.]|uniref:hypothetical protein n=1 Tax=Draconibacterium sp. TaxID=1965318 RepID=UPI0035625D4C
MRTTEKQENRINLVSTVSIIIMLILIGTGNVIFAQSPSGQQGPPPIPNSKQIKKMVAELAEDISLNEKQEKQVLTIYQEHFADVKKATSTGRPDRSKMEALKTGMENKVKAVLTEEQQVQFAAYLKKQEKKQHRGGPQ